MPTYIGLYQLTQQGIGNVKESPARVDKARTAIEAAGGKLNGFYLTMGEYDFVAISEFPDDETAAKFSLALGSGGNVRCQTLKAFPEADYRRIVSELP